MSATVCATPCRSATASSCCTLALLPYPGLTAALLRLAVPCKTRAYRALFQTNGSFLLYYFWHGLLQVVTRDRARLEAEGLSMFSFAFGVFNVALTAFLVGRFPEYFWKYHGVKSIWLLTYQVSADRAVGQFFMMASILRRKKKNYLDLFALF